MRGKLTRGLAAGVIAVIVSLPGGARPAQAVDVGTVTAVINAARAAYGLWNDFRGGNKGLEQAVAQIVATIESSKTAILTQMDQLAAADARACTRSAVIELADFSTFDQATARSWAQNVTGCVTLIDSLLDTVTTQSVIDQLGFALNTVGPIALAARARAGFTTTALTAVLVDGNNTVLLRYDPSCARAHVSLPNGAAYYTWTCTASNGDSAATSLYVDTRNGFPYYEPNLVPVKTQAARNTSEPLAVSVLPLLV